MTTEGQGGSCIMCLPKVICLSSFLSMVYIIIFMNKQNIPSGDENVFLEAISSPLLAPCILAHA